MRPTVHERATRKSEIFKPEGITHIEENYKARYVLESCIGTPAEEQGMWNWLNWPCAIFFQPDMGRVPKGGSQYFGIYHQMSKLTGERGGHICNAITCIEPFQGVVADNGDIIYSRYRHDHRWSPDESVWVDGGRDYLRYDGKSEVIGLKIVQGFLYKYDELHKGITDG